MVTPALKFGWPITIIRRKISKTFRFLIQFCSLCATKPKKKLDWKRSSTPHLTSFHEMRWREKNCLRKFESIEKTFQLLPIWRAGGLPSKPFPPPPTSLYQSLHTQSIFQLLNLPKGKSIFNQLKMVLNMSGSNTLAADLVACIYYGRIHLPLRDGPSILNVWNMKHFCFSSEFEKLSIML